jgi:NAD(P)H-hydrate repair Nnr-like enzyme with NAD(P)H-hydrate dehydratase domain
MAEWPWMPRRPCRSFAATGGTVDALDGIITALRAAGHEFVIPKKLTCTAGRHAMIH